MRRLWAGKRTEAIACDMIVGTVTGAIKRIARRAGRGGEFAVQAQRDADLLVEFLERLLQQAKDAAQVLREDAEKGTGIADSREGAEARREPRSH